MLTLSLVQRRYEDALASRGALVEVLLIICYYYYYHYYYYYYYYSPETPTGPLSWESQSGGLWTTVSNSVALRNIGDTANRGDI